MPQNYIFSDIYEHNLLLIGCQPFHIDNIQLMVDYERCELVVRGRGEGRRGETVSLSEGPEGLVAVLSRLMFKAARGLAGRQPWPTATKLLMCWK